MKEWERVMREAKQAFNDKVFSAALFLNKQALDLAKECFNEHVSEDPEGAVAAVMVSHFSLADSYIQIRDFQQAFDTYQLCFDFVQVISDTPEQSKGMEVAISHAVSHLQKEWYLFIKHHKDKLELMESSLTNDFQHHLHTLTNAPHVVH